MGNTDVAGWAHEMRAWYALTQGNYQGAVAASLAGGHAAPSGGVTVQLMAQRAKAWARIGDRRQVELALDAGRRLLEQMPYPTNLDNHFVVDPAKYDFYAMDCYRVVGENVLAATAAEEVIASSTDFDGTVRKPMRVAEAEITLGSWLRGAVCSSRRSTTGDGCSAATVVALAADGVSGTRRCRVEPGPSAATDRRLSRRAASGHPGLRARS